MPILIEHRINTIEQIARVPLACGAELDIRSSITQQGELVVTHDPWSAHVRFEDWLKAWVQHGSTGPLILNTKEDGLEARVMGLLEDYQVKDYFFLDTTIPTLVQWSIRKKCPHFAARFSQYEDVSLAFVGLVDWLWVDCFGGLKPCEGRMNDLRKHFKLCLVSPELQGYPLEDSWRSLAKCFDAVCTKQTAWWAACDQGVSP